MSEDDGSDGRLFLAGFTPMQTPPVPGWFAVFVRLMVDGTGEDDRLRGVVHARIDDDGGTEFEYRIARRGGLFRCETLDGKIHIIAGRDTVWQRRDSLPGLLTRPRVGYVAAPDDYEFGTARPDEEQWEGEDFTVPTGSPRQVSFLGRAAWEVELAPPAHKPFPMQIVIDAHSGLLLREANQAFDTYNEWAELDTDADLPDDLFTWNDTDQIAERYG